MEQLFGDFSNDAVRTASSIGSLSWVDPDTLKLKHRIGRGLFGDVWLATLHYSTEDFDGYHEVAVKVFPPLSKDQTARVLKEFEILYRPSLAPQGVNWPQGISIKDGKACITMKLYEGSLGDKMARSARNRLSLSDVIRYGSDLARGVLELHLHGMLALNLKPCNFLVDEQDRAVVGEFGMPLFFLGSPATSSTQLTWLGTPNYMAPEQWDARVRGPLHFEADSWGFACSIIEMITGSKPWDGMSSEDIFKHVVVRGQSPNLPSGLPVAIEKVLKNCLEYDYRQRPCFEEIFTAFTSPNVLFKEGDWIVDNVWGDATRIGIIKKVLGPKSVLLQYCDKLGETVLCSEGSRLNLWKNPIQVGDAVRVKLSVEVPRFTWHKSVQNMEGIVAAIDKENCIYSVSFPGTKEVWQADPVEIEPTCKGIVAGDWVLHKEHWPVTSAQRTPSSVGIVHHALRDGNVKVAFVGRETLWMGTPELLTKLSPLRVGQFVKLKNEVSSPRFDWPVKKNALWDTGKVARILPNGCLIINFPGRVFNNKGWFADPEEVEVVTLSTYEGLMQKYEHLQAMHWIVHPILCLLGFLAVSKMGMVISKHVQQPTPKKNKATSEEDMHLKLES